MTRTFTAVFDGQFLRPETPVELQPNTRYLITIQDVPAPAIEGDAWDVLESLIGTLDAAPDWSCEHDYYLYGTPKRQTTS